MTTASPRLDRVRIFWADHLGLARGKLIPARLADRGANHCITTFALNFDKTMVPAPGAMLLEGMPDMEAVFDPADIRPGWEDGVGVVVADLHFQGAPLPIAPRTVLRRAVDGWGSLGYETLVGIELEAYVLQPDGRGGWEPWATPGGYVYATGRAVDPAGLFDEIWAAADRARLRIESINSEYDSPQFELTLEHDTAMCAVDDILLFKVLAREVAQRHGLLLTFLGKPMANLSGSGLHVNFSMRAPDGTNAFLDASQEFGISPLARHAIGGLIAHHEGLAALCAPTVNAYKRLRPAQLSGYWANWGVDHRCATVRVPGRVGTSMRIEHRMSDGAANPYTATAAVLQAARLGVLGEIAPPERETNDGLETFSTDRHTPDNLALALDALQADTALVDAVGAEMVAQFVCVKRDEWAKWCAAVTDWERNYYLPYL